jgi:hypothetical protein
VSSYDILTGYLSSTVADGETIKLSNVASLLDGGNVGALVCGANVGCGDGTSEGDTDGPIEGASVGDTDGCKLGA